MGDPDAPPLDAEKLLQTLDRHDVDYVLVGGMAALVYGSTRVTFDLDVVPSQSSDNLEALARALRELNAQLRIETGDLVNWPLDADSLRVHELSTWRTDAGDLDIIRGIPTSAGMKHLAGYNQLLTKATDAEAFGVTISVASLDDIIDSKATAGRPTDLEALTELLRIQRHRTTKRRPPEPPAG